MKKFLIAGLMLLPFAANAAAPFVGYYQTIDDKTNSPKSIVRLYECTEIDDDRDLDAALCGRIVALYDDNGIADSKSEKIATEVAGSPKMVGMDILWNMEYDADDNEYGDGKILDPKSGSVYSSVMWQEKDEPTKIRVRGKIGPFGRTQVWNIMSESDLPTELKGLDTSKWTPKIVK
ncbi:MAG: DUF2147 domain-containing protein [Rickettsiales bacterium]|jgi:uncharacterized protein (DUF2147 family)|nr:DUF2147 domain-containing protein [Rickettsiales bacterium]